MFKTILNLLQVLSNTRGAACAPQVICSELLIISLVFEHFIKIIKVHTDALNSTKRAKTQGCTVSGSTFGHRMNCMCTRQGTYHNQSPTAVICPQCPNGCIMWCMLFFALPPPFS
jgi:hypothetical protein